MKLHALINLYNDRTFLAETLESLVDFVDRIIVADGAYAFYYKYFKPFNLWAQPWSTDGSLEIIEGFRDKPDTVILRQLEGDCWVNQAVKRTALVDAVPDGDWFIIIDADEGLQGDKQEAMEEVYDSGCICASIPVYLAGIDIDRYYRDWHPKIFKKMLAVAVSNAPLVW